MVLDGAVEEADEEPEAMCLRMRSASSTSPMNSTPFFRIEDTIASQQR
jgi:hypothetical protein